MPLYRLEDDDIPLSAEQPEFGMGIQIVMGDVHGVEQIGIILGDLVFMTRDEQSYEELSELFKEPWAFQEYLSGYSPPEEISAFDMQRIAPAFFGWWRKLPKIRLKRPMTRAHIEAWLTANYSPPRPARPASVYGHLPFNFKTRPDDVFYRYEAWPVSLRIHPQHKQINAMTFACPASEKQFVQCGFAAVGRYALPDLFPACWRWELKPLVGTHLDIGACVPLYGQAGGGVEVCFRSKSNTRSPISSPTVLPVY